MIRASFLPLLAAAFFAAAVFFTGGDSHAQAALPPFWLKPTALLAYEGGNATIDIYVLGNGFGPRTVTITTNLGSGATATAADLGTVPSTVSKDFVPARINKDVVTIPITADTIDEADEIFTVTVAVSGLAAAGTDTVTVTIPPTRYIVHDAYVFEGQTAKVDVVLLSPAPSGGLTFTVTTITSDDDSNLSASNSDIGTALSTFTIPAGEKKGTLSISTTSDTSDESRERFEVQLTTSQAGWSAVNGKSKSLVIIAADALSNTCSGCGMASITAVRFPQVAYADLIAKINDWRNDARYVSDKDHTDRWDRVLLALGETVSDTSLTKMSASEAQEYADRGWTRWTEVAEALSDLESPPPPPQQAQTPVDPPETPNRAPTVASPLPDVSYLKVGATRTISLRGVFDDPDDGDKLTISAASSNDAVVDALVLLGGSGGPWLSGDSMTLEGVSEGGATITVTATDPDGAQVSDTFEVSVIGSGQVLLIPPQDQDQDAQDPQDPQDASSSEPETTTVTVPANQEPETPDQDPPDQEDPSSSSEPETTTLANDAATGLSSNAARYDSDGDGKISRAELGVAMSDYSQGKMTYAEFLEIYTAFRAS